MKGKREFNLNQKWSLMAQADSGRREAAALQDMVSGWVKTHGDMHYASLATSAKRYCGQLDEVLAKSKNNVYNLYEAAAEVESDYAEKFGNLAFEMGLYASRVNALLSVLKPPGPVANAFAAPDFAERLETAKQNMVKEEIDALIANPDKLEHLNLDNCNPQMYIDYINAKYQGQQMFGKQNAISDVERDLLIKSYEHLHPEDAEKMNAFLDPVIQDGKYGADAQNIKYLTYASPETYREIIFQYLPNIAIADYEYTSTQHYDPNNTSCTDHPGYSIAVNLDSSAGEGLTDPRGAYVVFFHELGHAMDNMMKEDGTFDRSGSGLQESLSDDTFAKLEQAIGSIESDPGVVSTVLDSFKDGGTPIVPGSYEETVRNDVIELYRDTLTWDTVNNKADKVLSGQANQVTDILGGFTSNALGSGISGYAHSNAYWTDPNRDKPQSSEFFAHYFSARVTGYEVKDALLGDYYKGSTEFLDKELADVAEGLKKAEGP